MNTDISAVCLFLFNCDGVITRHRETPVGTQVETHSQELYYKKAEAKLTECFLRRHKKISASRGKAQLSW